MKRQRGFIDGRAIAQGILGLVIGAFVAGLAAGVMLTTGLPALWHWLRPLLHGWTA